jgi:hypothetical protein
MNRSVRLLLFCIPLLVLFQTEASAATSINGVPVFCVALNGAPVQEITQPGLGDAARASMNGMMPIILLDPNVLMSFGLDTQARLFIYAHECGHHALGHLLFPFSQYNEMQADCWGIKIGRDQGWFDVAALQREGQYFLSNPGDPWGHLPGPARVANFVRCFNDPMTAQQYQMAVVQARAQGRLFY